MSTETIESTVPASVLTRNQKKQYRKDLVIDGRPVVIIAEVRHDDECGNGHNSFAITAEIYEDGRFASGGCQHDEVAKHFPELAHLIKWHLTGTDAPMHYIANGLYWAGKDARWCDGKPGSPPNAEHFKSTIVFGAAPGDELTTVADLMALPRMALEARLQSRLLAMMEAFKRDVEAAGFVY